MVWYNITAYNIKVKLVLRNNEENVICNNKNAEGVMQMKCSKNLERAIVLGLILSTGVCGSAWAYTDLDDSGYWRGTTSLNGEGAEINNSTSKEFNSIDIVLNDDSLPNDFEHDTTTALNIKADAKLTGDISLINTAWHNNGTPIFGGFFTIYQDNNNGMFVQNGSTLDIDGNKIYIATICNESDDYSGESDAITASNTDHSNHGNNTVNLKGNKVQIIGNLNVRNTGDNVNSNLKNTINLELSSADSYWYGDAVGESGNNKINLSLSNGATWIYNDANFIRGNVNLDNGVICLADREIQKIYENTTISSDEYQYILSDYRSTDPHKCVTIENLKGSGGIFKVDLDWNENNSEKFTKDDYYFELAGVVIPEIDAPNSDYIFIENIEGVSTQIVDFDASKAHLENMEINKDRLYFANVENGTTSFITASSVYSNAGNVFDYTYGTGSETDINRTDTDWYIAVSGKSAESNPNFSAAKGAMYAGYALGAELDTLNKRMGEARYLEENDGVWVRYRHSKTGWDDTYETNGDMFQLGFDNEITEKDGKHYRGVAIDYTDADTNIMGISGDGEHERYAVSLYDTWLGEKGHYRDLVLRGGRINSDYDVSGAFSNGYEDIGGDYHQWFGSISAEWGRKNDMGTGWYFEPQVQAQLARIGGASYVSDSGIDVDQDGATSLIGRAGFRIGREYVKDNGKHDNFYIKADLLHEFAGDKSFSLTGNDGRYDKEYDGQETWCDVGIGADISLGKNSYFWADVERTFGADFDNTWQINGGFRWEF